MIENDIDEISAARTVLGIPYKELGIAISRSWNFPDKIVHSMEGLPPGDIKKPITEQETLQHMANYSNELCDIVANIHEGELLPAMEELSQRYQNSIPMTARQAVTLLESVTAQADHYSEIVRINRKTSPFMKNIIKLSQFDKGSSNEVKSERSQTPDTVMAAKSDSRLHMNGKENEQTPIVQNGIQEIAGVMKGTYTLGDVIYMILETIYRGFIFDRVVFSMRDTTHTKMIARFGLGEDIDHIIKQFHFTISHSSDIFNIAISQAKGIVINDADSPNIIRSLPEWYRLSLASPAFLVYPIFVKGVCIGMIYADRKSKGTLLTESQMVQMEELRKMAVDAIEQKRQGNS